MRNRHAEGTDIEKKSVGTALIETIRNVAVSKSCRWLWLITTNDNLPAQGFYKRLGFSVAAVHLNALQRSRELKPEIPQLGIGGVPLRDEIEFELKLAGVSAEPGT